MLTTSPQQLVLSQTTDFFVQGGASCATSRREPPCNAVICCSREAPPFAAMRSRRSRACFWAEDSVGKAPVLAEDGSAIRALVLCAVFFGFDMYVQWQVSWVFVTGVDDITKALAIKGLRLSPNALGANSQKVDPMPYPPGNTSVRLVSSSTPACTSMLQGIFAPHRLLYPCPFDLTVDIAGLSSQS
jgi:hypothetical protein